MPTTVHVVAFEPTTTTDLSGGFFWFENAALADRFHASESADAPDHDFMRFEAVVTSPEAAEREIDAAWYAALDLHTRPQPVDVRA